LSVVEPLELHGERGVVDPPTAEDRLSFLAILLVALEDVQDLHVK